MDIRSAEIVFQLIFLIDIHDSRRASNDGILATPDLPRVARNESHYRTAGQPAATIVMPEKKPIKPRATGSLAIQLGFSFRVSPRPTPTCGALARVYASRDRARTYARTHARTHAPTCAYARASHVSFRWRNAHLAHMSATMFIRSAFPRDWMPPPSVSAKLVATPTSSFESHWFSMRSGVSRWDERADVMLLHSKPLKLGSCPRMLPTREHVPRACFGTLYNSMNIIVIIRHYYTYIIRLTTILHCILSNSFLFELFYL